MLISEFARATGLSVDTVRFYVRRGLIIPQLSDKGGRNPYQVFTDEHISVAKIIRVAQSLGMSLKEISSMIEERRKGRFTREKSLKMLKTNLERLDAKAAEMDAMRSYLRDKIAWKEGGEVGACPDFDEYAKRATREVVLV